jgi:short subunit dehydrogenase-like uncharacterized protein
MLGDMREKRWLLYGASGYTGRLISDECARQVGLAPTLGGRDEVRLKALAEARGWPHLAIGLDDAGALAAALRDFAVVLHCAGPFSTTSAPMRAACLASGTHYLDITGEIDVYVEAHAQHAAAQAAGVVLCPGVGFDVVPTDCIAACLKEALPDATALALGFNGVDRLSAGTTVTSMEAVFRGCARVRLGGRIVDVPFGERSRTADFGRGPEPTFVIPWGDVATAYFSTGIPDIEVHVPARSASARAIRALVPLRRVLANAPARRWAHALLRKVAAGPTTAQREKERAMVWGEARNGAGEVRRATLETMNGYTLTAATALMAVRHVLEGGSAGGYFTPSRLMGSRCVERVNDGGRIVLG